MSSSLPPPYDQIHYYSTPGSSSSPTPNNRRGTIISYYTNYLPNSLVEAPPIIESYASPLDIRFPTPPPPYSTNLDIKKPPVYEPLPWTKKCSPSENKKFSRVRKIIAFTIFFVISFMACIQFAFHIHGQSEIGTKVLMSFIYEFAVLGYFAIIGVCIYASMKSCKKRNRTAVCVF